jgi:hypothetical protein
MIEGRCPGIVIGATKERAWEGEVYRFAGEIASQSSDRDTAKAEAYFKRSLAIARYRQAKSWELRAARAWRGSGAIRESRTRHVSFSPRYTAGSPKGSTRSM